MTVDFDHNFGFLISDIARLQREKFNVTAQALGLTLAQSRALVHLARNEGVTQAILAGFLEIQPITLLRQLDKLEENGLIKRQPDPADRRKLRLYLTTRARPLLESITTLGSEMTEAAFTGINDADRALAIAVLERVKKNLVQPSQTQTPAGEARSVLDV